MATKVNGTKEGPESCKGEPSKAMADKPEAAAQAGAGGGKSPKAPRELTSIDVAFSIEGVESWFRAEITPEPDVTLAEILAALKDPEGDGPYYFDPRIDEKLLTVWENGRKVVLGKIVIHSDDVTFFPEVERITATYWEGDESTGKEVEEEVPATMEVAEPAANVSITAEPIGEMSVDRIGEMSVDRIGEMSVDRIGKMRVGR